MKTILVIEDEPDILDNVCDLLDAEDYVAFGAENGRQGVELARRYRPDLIICDVMMPEMDGHEVLHTLREDPGLKTVPFIFLTARAERGDLRVGMNLGADDYITKPFSAVDLLEAIDARLSRQTAYQARQEQRLEELRRNLSSTLPHELRTPLASILGFSTFLREDWDALSREEAMEMLGHIHSAGKRLERLAENYGLYTQLELMASGPKDQDQSWRRQRSTPAGIESTLRSRAEAYDREADLSLDLEDAQLAISHNYFCKLVDELVDNAFKFSEPGKAVGVAGRPEADAYLLTVSDGGHGMRPEQVAEIGAFMQFDRAEREQQGTGLGLSLAGRMAQLHGGWLTVESEAGAGTTVRVTLPLAGADAFPLWVGDGGG